jgi:hypothetical protein
MRNRLRDRIRALDPDTDFELIYRLRRVVGPAVAALLPAPIRAVHSSPASL